MGHPGNPGRIPLAVCSKASVSVFLWLCSQLCFGCVSTAAKGLTRCVLSATPAPLLGPGSANNPEAIFATICRQIFQQIRLITTDSLIRRISLFWYIAIRIQVNKVHVFHTWPSESFKSTHPSSAAKSWMSPYPGLGSGHPMWELFAILG